MGDGLVNRTLSSALKGSIQLSRNFGLYILDEKKSHLRKSIILVSIISKVRLYHSERRVTSFKGELFLYYTDSADNRSDSESSDSEAGEWELF